MRAGTGRARSQPLGGALSRLGEGRRARDRREIVAIDRKGEIEENQRAILKDLEGIVLLDGTWSQAKALWWRNAWMLKCQRVILGPAHPSRYGKLRREPRRDGCPPSRLRRCCSLASKSGPISPRRCTTVSSACWQNIGRRKARCRSLRPSRNQARLTAAANGADDGAPTGSPDGTRVIPRFFRQAGTRFAARKSPALITCAYSIADKFGQSAPNWRTGARDRLKARQAMTDDSESVALRPTVTDGKPQEDDYEVIWRGLPIGRILKPPGEPHWWWAATSTTAPTANDRGPRSISRTASFDSRSPGQDQGGINRRGYRGRIPARRETAEAQPSNADGRQNPRNSEVWRITGPRRDSVP